MAENEDMSLDEFFNSLERVEEEGLSIDDEEDRIATHMIACWLLHSVTPAKHFWNNIKKEVAKNCSKEEADGLDDHMVIQTGFDPYILRKLFKVLENNQACEDPEIRLGKALTSLAKILDCKEEFLSLIDEEMS
jgi:hypothetical protein